MCANGTPVRFDVSPNNDMIVFQNKGWGKKLFVEFLPCLCIAHSLQSFLVQAIGPV